MVGGLFAARMRGGLCSLLLLMAIKPVLIKCSSSIVNLGTKLAGL